MERIEWMRMTCDELATWVDDVFLEAQVAVSSALLDRTIESRQLAERQLRNLEGFIRAIKAKRCMYPRR